jgi:hypothetical protein
MEGPTTGVFVSFLLGLGWTSQFGEVLKVTLLWSLKLLVAHVKTLRQSSVHKTHCPVFPRRVHLRGWERKRPTQPVPHQRGQKGGAGGGQFPGEKEHF